jgi:hypothetical protein
MQPQCVPHEEIEWCLFHCQTCPGVMDILCEWQPRHPIGLLVVGVNVDILFQPLVRAFWLPICLWVVSNTNVLSDIEEVT